MVSIQVVPTDEMTLSRCSKLEIRRNRLKAAREKIKSNLTTKIWLYGPPDETKELACRLSLIADIGSAADCATGDDPLVCCEVEAVLDDGLTGQLISAAALLTAVAEEIGGGVAEHLEAAIEHITRAANILAAEGEAGQHPPSNH
ncbi:MAG: hypothetical protein FOGNACKC_00751 [Anaerolineae bacterium]|nr:hypothetical protein [Anaerolineae bacterium]